jgi:hypothetical protein
MLLRDEIKKNAPVSAKKKKNKNPHYRKPSAGAGLSYFSEKPLQSYS